MFIRCCFGALMLCGGISCTKNRSLSIEFIGMWKATEMMNPPHQFTSGYIPVPQTEGYFAEFLYGGKFRGHYYFLDGWTDYQVWPESNMLTLYRNRKTDSLRVGYTINEESDRLNLNFGGNPQSRLKLVRE